LIASPINIPASTISTKVVIQQQRGK